MAIDLVADAEAILGDLDTFGQRITITAPNGVRADLAGLAAETGERLDLDSGASVAGASAHITVSSRPFAEIFGEVLPAKIAQRTERPWVVSFEDASGVERTFMISDTRPDRRLGLLTCLLESYRS